MTLQVDARYTHPKAPPKLSGPPVGHKRFVNASPADLAKRNRMKNQVTHGQVLAVTKGPKKPSRQAPRRAPTNRSRRPDQPTPTLSAAHADDGIVLGDNNMSVLAQLTGTLPRESRSRAPARKGTYTKSTAPPRRTAGPTPPAPSPAPAAAAAAAASHPTPTRRLPPAPKAAVMSDAEFAALFQPSEPEPAPNRAPSPTTAHRPAPAPSPPPPAPATAAASPPPPTVSALDREPMAVGGARSRQLRRQRTPSPVIEEYFPFGRPGAGAPVSTGTGKRTMTLRTAESMQGSLAAYASRVDASVDLGGSLPRLSTPQQSASNDMRTAAELARQQAQQQQQAANELYRSQQQQRAARPPTPQQLPPLVQRPLSPRSERQRQWREDLAKQIEEKKQRKAKELQAAREQEEREARAAASYNPWGRPGAGAAPSPRSQPTAAPAAASPPPAEYSFSDAPGADAGDVFATPSKRVNALRRSDTITLGSNPFAPSHTPARDDAGAANALAAKAGTLQLTPTDAAELKRQRQLEYQRMIREQLEEKEALKRKQQEEERLQELRDQERIERELAELKRVHQEEIDRKREEEADKARRVQALADANETAGKRARSDRHNRMHRHADESGGDAPKPPAAPEAAPAGPDQGKGAASRSKPRPPPGRRKSSLPRPRRGRAGSHSRTSTPQTDADTDADADDGRLATPAARPPSPPLPAVAAAAGAGAAGRRQPRPPAGAPAPGGRRRPQPAASTRTAAAPVDDNFEVEDKPRPWELAPRAPSPPIPTLQHKMAAQQPAQPQVQQPHMQRHHAGPAARSSSPPIPALRPKPELQAMQSASTPRLSMDTTADSAAANPNPLRSSTGGGMLSPLPSADTALQGEVVQAPVVNVIDTTVASAGGGYSITSPNSMQSLVAPPAPDMSALAQERRQAMLMQLNAAKQSLLLRQRELASEMEWGDRVLLTRGQKFAVNDIAREQARQALEDNIRRQGLSELAARPSRAALLSPSMQSFTT